MAFGHDPQRSAPHFHLPVYIQQQRQVICEEASEGKRQAVSCFLSLSLFFFFFRVWGNESPFMLNII